ncbi:uncharacterized protein N0V89_012240 [Didymosphaeria variabile]|uniref:Uncharacterized protein n=1 Tax=Didymosphaeria variabile TaxID=1932322 RepID=A0A9W8XA41_9PLEO|nr:uncharacterized protein N0V89_012240 [Didymosphaeria variabile]KAJ4344497.1 hypothetical protein N0V89_012240 [Didymosphaeria variabile]
MVGQLISLQYFRGIHLNRVITELIEAVAQQEMKRADGKFERSLPEPEKPHTIIKEQPFEYDEEIGFIDWKVRHDWIDREVAKILEMGRLAKQKRSNELPQFFSLPPELRTRVYHELWKNTPQVNYRQPDGWEERYYGGWRGFPDHWLESPYMILVYGDYDNNPIQQTRRGYEVDYIWGPASLPSWLLANKQMLCEGLAQLRLKSTLVMSRCFDPFHGMHRHLVRPINDIQTLTITNLEYGLVGHKRYGVAKDQARHFPSHSSLQLERKLRGIRNLKIEFIQRTNRFVADYEVDLPHCISGLLSALKHLEVVTFVEHFTWMNPMEPDQSIRPHYSREMRLKSLQEFIQDAVQEHGRVLSGDETFDVEYKTEPLSAYKLIRWTYTFRKRTHDKDTLDYWRSVRRTKDSVIREMHKGFLGANLKFASITGAGRTDLSGVLERY